MTISRWIVVAAVWAGILAWGCARTAREVRMEAPLESASGAEQPVVQVYNRSSRAVTVYLLLEGSRYRLGRVVTARTERFPIDGYAGWDLYLLRIFVDPIGSSESYTSDAFRLEGGQWVDLVVEEKVPLSSYMVRNY